MKSMIIFFVCAFLTLRCSDNREVQDERSKNDTLSSEDFPLKIEGGKKTVYRFGKMTPRGLKYFYDTVDVSSTISFLTDSLHVRYLSPISLSSDDRHSAPCIIAISIPGVWEEAIFGKIDTTGHLLLNYKLQDILAKPRHELAFNTGRWSAIFVNDTIEIKVSALLTDTEIGDHLTGKGRIEITERDNLVDEHEIFMVYNKRQPIRQ